MGRCVTSSGKTESIEIEQPFFYKHGVSTCLILKNGETVLAAGGMPTREGDKLVYVFVTAKARKM